MPATGFGWLPTQKKKKTAIEMWCDFYGQKKSSKQNDSGIQELLVHVIQTDEARHLIGTSMGIPKHSNTSKKKTQIVLAK